MWTRDSMITNFVDDTQSVVVKDEKLSKKSYKIGQKISQRIILKMSKKIILKVHDYQLGD